MNLSLRSRIRSKLSRASAVFQCVMLRAAGGPPSRSNTFPAMDGGVGVRDWVVRDRLRSHSATSLEGISSALQALRTLFLGRQCVDLRLEYLLRQTMQRGDEGRESSHSAALQLYRITYSLIEKLFSNRRASRTDNGGARRWADAFVS